MNESHSDDAARKKSSVALHDPREAPTLEPEFRNVTPCQTVDHALRTVTQNQVHQSAMADVKANIMITVCSIVVTLSAGQLNNPSLFLPVITMGAFALLALLLAILAVVPRLGHPTTPDGEVDSSHPSFSLLFFGHIGHMPIADFKRELAQLISDPAVLYDTIARDIHSQAQILARRKFRYLRWSYLFFITGILAAAGSIVVRLVFL